MYSDTCPNCERVIEFSTADAQHLNHEHDNGKGGKCRFQGKVVAGKIQANLRVKQFSDECPRCKQTIHFDKADAQDLDNEHDDGKGGKCRFRGAVVGGRIQANGTKVATKKCFKCGTSKTETEYATDEWNKSGKNANRRKCKICE